jgi:quercetin dioxygenase-like cupin family protein
MKDGAHLYQVEKRARYGERPGFKITELHIQPTQEVPWHTHTVVRDSFYVIDGSLKIFMDAPIESVVLKRGDFFSVAAGRPHRVTNATTGVTQFLVIGDAQGAGEYDYIPYAASSE